MKKQYFCDLIYTPIVDSSKDCNNPSSTKQLLQVQIKNDIRRANLTRALDLRNFEYRYTVAWSMQSSRAFFQ